MFCPGTNCFATYTQCREWSALYAVSLGKDGRQLVELTGIRLIRGGVIRGREVIGGRGESGSGLRTTYVHTLQMQVRTAQ